MVSMFANCFFDPIPFGLPFLISSFYFDFSAFEERKYERLTSNVVCAGLSSIDEKIAQYELNTSLKDSFLGLSYTYDDTGQSEGWMKTILNESGETEEAASAAMAALETDDGVIKAQVSASMQALLIVRCWHHR